MELSKLLEFINKLLKIKEELGENLEITSEKLHDKRTDDFRLLSIIIIQEGILGFVFWFCSNPQFQENLFTDEQFRILEQMTKPENKSHHLLRFQAFLVDALIDKLYFAFDYLFANYHYYATDSGRIQFTSFLKENSLNGDSGALLLSAWRNTFHNNGFSLKDIKIEVRDKEYNFFKDKQFEYELEDVTILLEDLIVFFEELLLKSEIFGVENEKFAKQLPNHFTLHPEFE